MTLFCADLGIKNQLPLLIIVSTAVTDMANTTLLDTMHHAAKAWCILFAIILLRWDGGTERTAASNQLEMLLSYMNFFYSIPQYPFFPHAPANIRTRKNANAGMRIKFFPVLVL